MKPISMKLKNFMSHGNSSIDFSKVPTASLIIGKEDGSFTKSNATGKTTLFSAIRFALFDASVTKKSKIIRENAKKCVVEFVFELSDETQYKIIRTRTKSTKNMLLFKKEDDNWMDISGRTNTHTDELLSKIIKINQKTFENSSYFKQDDRMNLASATPERRKEIIRNMLQLDIWGKYEKHSKILRNEKSKDMDVTKRLLDTTGEPEIDIEKFSIELSAYELEIENLNNKREEKSKELDHIKKEFTLLKKTYDSEYPGLIEKLKNEKNELLKIENMISKSKHGFDMKMKEKELKINILPTCKQDHIDNNARLEQLKSNVPENILDEEYNEVVSSISKNKTEIKYNEVLFKKTATSLPEDDSCPVCYTELDEKTRKKIAATKQQNLDEIASVISKARKELSYNENRKDMFDNKINTYRAYARAYMFAENNISKLDNVMKMTNSQIEMLDEQLASLKDDIEAKKISRDVLVENIVSASKRIKELCDNDSSDRLDDLALILKKESFVFESIREDINDSIRKKGMLENALETRKIDLVKKTGFKDKLGEISHELKIYEAVVTAFGSSGIPAMIVTTVLDGLQKETNDVLDVLRRGIQVQFFIEKENSNGEPVDTLGMRFFVGNSEWDYDDLSGGQKACVALALKLAVAVVNRNRCGADIKMLLLDEVDQALDQDGIDAFYEVIKKWSDELYILVITHNEQLSRKFNSFIVVEKRNGVAGVKV